MQPEIAAERARSSWSLQTGFSIPRSTTLRDKWHELSSSSEDIFSLYQSPEWFECMRASPDRTDLRQSVAVYRDTEAHLVGVVPLYLTRNRCRFPIVLSRAYTTSPFLAITLTGQLLMPAENGKFDALFSEIWKFSVKPLPIKVDYLPVHGPLYRFLTSSRQIRERFFVYQDPGFRGVCIIPLTATYEGFLARHTAKRRYNLRRQQQLLSEHGDGKLELRRCKSSESVEEFVESVVEIKRAAGFAIEASSDGSWSSLRTRLMSMEQSQAALGFQRSYVLMCRERPVSYIQGCLHGRTFYVRKTELDPAYARFSPGTTLLQLVIADLIKDKCCTAINLGWSQPPVEHDRCVNVFLDYALVWLFPRTWENRIVTACYQAFRHTVGFAKLAIAR
jgi:hypothetical protein